MKYDIIIVGAGAAGLCAAYVASCANINLRIAVLERQSVCGRKLSASGNGKGNLTNADFQSECYHSFEQKDIEQWVLQHSHKEIVSFFDQIGIPLYEKNGYYYPISNQAKQVTGLLVDKCRKNGVSFIMNTEVTDVGRKRNRDNCYVITDAEGNTYEGSSLILSTGGAAAPKLGGSQSGYQLARELKHSISPIRSVLCPIYVEDPLLKLAKGVRLDGAVTLLGADGVIARESGQIQWNEDNLSGIVMMNLSCYLPYQTQEMELHIDLLPDHSWNVLKTYLKQQCDRNPKQTIQTLLLGIFPSAMAQYLLRRLCVKESLTGQEISEKQLNRITSNIKKLSFCPLSKEDYEKAQVTSGGVRLSEIDLTTMESRQDQDVYLVGELLDVNGCCGGYNLTFAMLSGMQAANAIIEKKVSGGRYDRDSWN